MTSRTPELVVGLLIGFAWGIVVLCVVLRS